MIRFSISGAEGLDDIVTYMQTVDARAKDLMPLGMEIAQIMDADNMAARMAGEDKDGQELRPLMDSTIRRWPNRIDDTPLIPMGQASRPISAFETSVENAGVGHVVITGGWPTFPQIGYHKSGTVHMTQRDPVGIRPIGWALIGDALDKFTDSLFGESFGGF